MTQGLVRNFTTWSSCHHHAFEPGSQSPHVTAHDAVEPVRCARMWLCSVARVRTRGFMGIFCGGFFVDWQTDSGESPRLSQLLLLSTSETLTQRIALRDVFFYFIYFIPTRSARGEAQRSRFQPFLLLHSSPPNPSLVPGSLQTVKSILLLPPMTLSKPLERSLPRS
jgi:hypothetical protein